MSNNIFGSGIPDGLTLTPAANSSDDKYVQGISPSRSTPVANASVDSISKSGFYYNTSGSVKPTIHVETASPLVKMQLSLDSTGLSYRQKYGTTTWSDVKYVVTRDGNQYIQNITTDNITALNIPLSTSSGTQFHPEGIKYKANTNAALTNDIAIRSVFKANGVDNINLPGGGYGLQFNAPSQSNRLGAMELNEFGKVWTSYSGWFHENYINKTNDTTGQYVVNTPPGATAMKLVGNGAGWGTQFMVEGIRDPSNMAWPGSGANILYHKPGVAMWKVGVCEGGGEVYDSSEFQFRHSFQPSANNGVARMVISSAGYIWTSAYGSLHNKFFYDPSGRLKNNHWIISNGYIEVIIDGVPRGISFFNSDARLKKNIKDTKRDSLSEINQIEFKSFDYIDDRYNSKQNGVIAQQIEAINPDWVNTMSDGGKMPDTNDLLVSALHAIQQLNKKVEELEKKLESK